MLDQHKEKTPKDPTIREKFNTSRFADYKEHVVDLLARVVAVSLETVAITDAMSAMRPLRAMRDRVQRRPRPWGRIRMLASREAWGARGTKGVTAEAQRRPLPASSTALCA